MSTDFLPSREAELVTWVGVFGSQISATPTAFGLTAIQATAYSGLSAAFISAYNIAKSDATRTPTAIIAKNQAKDALIAETRLLAGIVQKCPTVTNMQRSDLGLTVHASPSPIPPPSERPGVDIVSVVARTVKVHIHDSASSSKRGKPPGVLGASVYAFVGAVYPTDPTAWAFQGTTTKTTFDVVFPDTVANGAQVWICATWFNKTTQTGPVSLPITTNVQGGLSMAA